MQVSLDGVIIEILLEDTLARDDLVNGGVHGNRTAKAIVLITVCVAAVCVRKGGHGVVTS